jgi:hypothetical protein
VLTPLAIPTLALTAVALIPLLISLLLISLAGRLMAAPSCRSGGCSAEQLSRCQ